MGKRPEDIKKQKEKELAKKKKALEKRRTMAKKSDPEFIKQQKETAQTEKLKRKEEISAKTTLLADKITSCKVFLPVTVILCFLIMCIKCYSEGYSVFSSEFSVNGLFHCLYAGDLSIGFTSRLFIGSILSLFTDVLTAQTINIFAKTALYISFILQSLLTAAVIKKGIGEKNLFIILFAVIFIVDPLTVTQYAFYFGVLDLYNYIVFLVTVFIFVKGKSNLQFAVPLLCFVGLLIHYQFFFAFFPALFVLGLYRTVNSERKELRKEFGAFSLNTAVGVVGFFWFSVFAKNFLRMNVDEMITYVSSKTDPESVYIFEDYLKYYLFDVYKGEQFDSYGQSLKELISINMGLTKPSVYIKYLTFAVPLIIIFWILWGILIKREKGIRKLPFIAASIMPFALVFELILSSDVWRWASSTVVCQFGVLFALYLMKAPSVTTLLDDIRKAKLPVKIISLLIFAAYIGVSVFFTHSLYR